jgi:hypothetical protein
MSQTLTQFDEKTLNEAKNAWFEMAVKLDMPSTEYEKIFEWAEKRINYENGNGDSLAYGFYGQSKECLAVVDIVHDKRGIADKGRLKMLTVNLCPKFSTSQIEADVNKIEQVLDVYSEVTIGTIMLTSVHKSSIIKLYGRDDPMLNLLLALKERINGHEKIPLKANMEGRWLSLSLK